MDGEVLISINCIQLCHIITGDLWAGAETQVYSLVLEQLNNSDLNVSVILFNDNKLAQRLKENGVQVHILPEFELSSIQIFIRMVNIFRRNKVSLVHCHGFKENFIGGWAAKLLNIKVVRTHHGKGMISSGGVNRFIEKVNNIILTCAQIVVSNDLEEYLIKERVASKALYVVHNGFNIEVFNDQLLKNSVRAKYGIKNDEFVVGTAGRLVPIKALDKLIESARLVIDKYPLVKFLIVGEGPEREILEKKIIDYNLKSQIILTGHQERVLDFIGAMDVFVLSSLHEGVPMVLLESMYLGVPIIASRVGGIPEILTDKFDAILVTKASVEEIAMSISELIENDSFRKDLSQNPMQSLRERFMVSNTEKNTFNVYKKCLQ